MSAPSPAIPGFPSNLFWQIVTIVSGASATEVIQTNGLALVGIVMPSAWTAADIAFKSCMSGNPNEMQQLFDSGGNPEKTAAAASHNIAFPSSDALFVPFLQLVSVSTSDDTTPVTQGADRTLKLLFRNYLS